MSVMTATAWTCPPKTILVAVDFGEASARALAVASVIATAFDSSVRAVHAERFEPPPYFTLEQIERLEAERRAAQEDAVAHVAEFAARASMRPVTPIVLDEPPVDAILDAAAKTDLIVLGTHGRRGPGRWWLGSVAERVVRAAVVPVLVTRSGTAPAADVFRRIAVIHEGADGGAGRAYAETLTRISGGDVVDGGMVSTCGTDVVRQASLVVIARAAERVAWALTDPAARVLTNCEAPVLFVPDLV
jgi:nucleotide-binding universal stress UspA family protein